MNRETALNGTLAMQLAEMRALQAFVERGFLQLGLTEIDGIPLQRWQEKRYFEELEKALLNIGDKNPAVSDEIYKYISDRLAKYRKNPSA